MGLKRLINQQAILITGASSGIGRCCAIHLDKLGFSVFAGVRSNKDGESLQQQSSGGISPVILDITDVHSIACAVENISSATGESGLYALVNNAGIAIAGPLECLPLDKLREQLEVNVVGQVAVTQAFLPLLRKNSGRIINMGSIEGRIALPFIGPYCASKFALEAITDVLRLELMSWGIKVSIIEPAIIETPIMNKSINAARDVLGKLPQNIQELYSPLINPGMKAAEKIVKIAVSPQLVARIAGRALLSKKPKTRYTVGACTGLLIKLRMLIPDRLFDRLVMRFMNIR